MYMYGIPYQTANFKSANIFTMGRFGAQLPNLIPTNVYTVIHLLLKTYRCNMAHSIYSCSI